MSLFAYFLAEKKVQEYRKCVSLCPNNIYLCYVDFRNQFDENAWNTGKMRNVWIFI